MWMHPNPSGREGFAVDGLKGGAGPEAQGRQNFPTCLGFHKRNGGALQERDTRVGRLVLVFFSFYLPAIGVTLRMLEQGRQSVFQCVVFSSYV